MAGQSCTLCPRRCGADRTADKAGGRCNMPTCARVSLASLHMWEEPPISGTRGSGAVFFAGCSLGCVFCQNHEISHGGAGRAVDARELSEIFRRLEAEGAHNIDLVTGTHFIPAIIEALELYRPQIPVVWNSGGYETVESVDMIAPYIDIWLPDYKYGLAQAAEKYSAAPDYPDVAMTALRRMRQYSPVNETDGSGLLKKGMLVRHLVLPANTRSSVAALKRIAEELPGVPISLMSQYFPAVKDARFPELSRRITAREYEKVCACALELGLDGFMQERESADKCYVPKWEC